MQFIGVSSSEAGIFIQELGTINDKYVCYKRVEEIKPFMMLVASVRNKNKIKDLLRQCALCFGLDEF